MTTPSPKLQLAVPTQVDDFSTDDLAANWQKIDGSPGSFICTSSTRPSWSTAQIGRKILETNTGLEWRWDGTAFQRMAPVGLLRRSDGSFAVGERTSQFTTTSNTYVRAVSVTNVVVPEGNRPLRIDVAWNRARNPDGNFSGAIYRSDTNNSGPRESAWVFGTSASDANAGGGVNWALLRNGLPAGTYSWSFQITGPTGTSIIDASATSPITIFVTEL